MRISGNEPSSVIHGQTKEALKLKTVVESAKTSWSQKGCCNKPTKLQFQFTSIRNILMLSKRL